MDHAGEKRKKQETKVPPLGIGLSSCCSAVGVYIQSAAGKSLTVRISLKLLLAHCTDTKIQCLQIRIFQMTSPDSAQESAQENSSCDSNRIKISFWAVYRTIKWVHLTVAGGASFKSASVRRV